MTIDIGLPKSLSRCPSEITLIDRLDHVKGGGHLYIAAIPAINLCYGLILGLDFAKQVLADTIRRLFLIHWVWTHGRLGRRRLENGLSCGRSTHIWRLLRLLLGVALFWQILRLDGHIGLGVLVEDEVRLDGQTRGSHPLYRWGFRQLESHLQLVHRVDHFVEFLFRLDILLRFAGSLLICRANDGHTAWLSDGLELLHRGQRLVLECCQSR